MRSTQKNIFCRTRKITLFLSTSKHHNIKSFRIFVLRKSNAHENTILYLSDLYCIAYIISADYPYSFSNHCGFFVGRCTLLGILSRQDMVAINLFLFADSGQSTGKGEDT